MEQVLQQVCSSRRLQLLHVERLHGGDINQAFCIHTNKGKFFVKINQTESLPGMFAAEADGLSTLRNSSVLVVPQVHAHGETGGWQWLLLEWHEKGNTPENFWEDFGSGLAAMHKNSQPLFGYAIDNYIGSLHQSNKPTESWGAFYTEQRIYPLSKRLFDDGVFGMHEMKIAEQSGDFFNNIFPQEPSALLHGDLWSGNFMAAANGQPFIYDPAVYFGHREMDIGMTLLFGGFDRKFYTAYNNTWPLEKDWQKRVEFTQLYPLLVHAVLFGGHYVAAARKILLRCL